MAGIFFRNLAAGLVVGKLLWVGIVALFAAAIGLVGVFAWSHVSTLEAEDALEERHGREDEACYASPTCDMARLQYEQKQEVDSVERRPGLEFLAMAGGFICLFAAVGLARLSRAAY